MQNEKQKYIESDSAL